MPAPNTSTGPVLHIGDRAVHISQKGQGSTVLLLHGNASNGDEILRVCPEVSNIAWLAPDRPGYGQSDPPPDGNWDPVSAAEWVTDLIGAVAPGGVTLVAHSLAAGQAMIAAARRPDLIASLVLLAPFCRPTPHRWMPLLRVASRPVLGLPIRYVAVPLVGKLFGQRLLARLLQAETQPPWLAELSVNDIAGGEAMTSTARELRAFNAGMKSVEKGLRINVPTCVIWGDADETALRDWHFPWLRSRIHQLECHVVPKAGHLVHHDAPVAVLSQIIAYSERGRDRGRSPSPEPGRMQPVVVPHPS